MLNIVVCVKAVPDPNEACNIKIDPETKTLLRCDVPMVINPLDKNAMEAALQLKRTRGAKITVLSMGPPPAGQIVKECLALGADRGILICLVKIHQFFQKWHPNNENCKDGFVLGLGKISVKPQ